MNDPSRGAFCNGRITQPGQIRTADGVDLFYRDWGQGQQVLFLSGWTLNSHMWGYQMQPLSQDGFRCMAYDRRGHGRSSDPGKGYDFDTLADDLAAVIDALDLTNLVLVAHSFSSGEVVRYLARHGADRVAGVVFVAPAAIPFLLKTEDNPGGIDAAFFEQFWATLADNFEGWAEEQAEAYFAGTNCRAIIDATLAMMNLTSHQAMMMMSMIQPVTDFRAELAQFPVPALFLHGDRDASAPIELTSSPAAQIVPNASLKIYDGAGHGLYFTHKRQLNRDIAGFARGMQ